MMGGAPQGPAGTGKTETTKDLGRGLAIWVIVSNCSDQMNNEVTGNFFSGLVAQTGAWGCFDEFNRIGVEVLSVIAGQYGALLDGMKAVADEIIFEEEKINLRKTIGAWITMDPGYAGRTDLPENLKALVCHFAAFKSLIASLQVAHAEAKDNVKYLAALKPNLDEFNGTDFEQVSLCIKPIMHMLLLVWKHSKFYNTPPALSLIIRMVCNAMMEKAREFTGTTDELFNLEPKEAVEKLVIVLDGCRQLKYDYYTYYNLSKTQCESNPWMADRGTMFKRFDSFITRCEDLLHLCKTVQQFEKLQVVVVGGDSGSTLTENVEGVNAAFLKIFTTIKVSAPCPQPAPHGAPPRPPWSPPT